MKKSYPRKAAKRLRNSRLFVIAFLLLSELLLMLILANFLGELQPYGRIFLRCLSLLAVFWELTRSDNASYKISWIVLLLLAPFSGLLFYLIFGNKRFGINMKKQLNAYSEVKSRTKPKENHCLQVLREQNPMAARLAEYLFRVSNGALYSQTSVEYFPCGEKLFQQMLEELKQAKKFIFLEFFIIRQGLLWDAVLDILEKKAAEGVEIKILYDDVGCIQTLPRGYEEILRQKGMEVVLFNPLQPRLNTILNYRDHRKICVIDGNVGFTGGVNLSDEYINYVERCGYWKDTGLMLKGPAVQGLTELFLQLWQFSTGAETELSAYLPTVTEQSDGFVQPFGDDPMSSSHPGKTAYLQLCAHARKSLFITTPYLILDDEMRDGLMTAALSGVDVRIITPHIPDKWYVFAVTRSFYRPLLESGVRIFEYTPGFIHAKMMVADGDCAIVGSTNLDFRSFYLQFECGVLLYGNSAVKAVEQDFLETQALSQEITMEQEEAVPRWKRLGRLLLRILAPLM